VTSIAISRDGTKIVYDKVGSGPVVIMVGGALTSRSDFAEQRLAKLLGPKFTVVNYDRRGRGDSTDTPPYSPSLEVEDIEALVDELGGTVFLYGISSGAALALRAARALGKRITKLAVYEPAYDSSSDGLRATKEYNRLLREFLKSGRRGDAVALFMRFVGVQDGQIIGIRNSPMWPRLEAMAPTLAYDSAILGKDRSVPEKMAAKVKVITLVMCGQASPPFMQETAQALSRAIPNAQIRVLGGQSHDVKPEALVPVLTEFFMGTETTTTKENEQ
jgi:pimeloyl-ACP methyl ester carboxylesterase